MLTIRGNNILDLSTFHTSPLYAILIRFLNLPLLIGNEHNSTIQQSMDMSDEDYVIFRVNELVSAYLDGHDYNALVSFQSDVIKICEDTFSSVSRQKGLLTRLSTPEGDIKYSVSFTQDNELFEIHRIKTIAGYCILAIARLLNTEIIIRNCENCNRFFVPTSRSDEIYCDRIFKNNKTCKQIGYNRKVENDPYLKAYRKAYKTKNAYKLRNINNSPGIEERFSKWVAEAKKKLEEARTGRITIGEFNTWLKSQI